MERQFPAESTRRAKGWKCENLEACSFILRGHFQAKGQGVCPKGNVRTEKVHGQGAELCELTERVEARPEQAQVLCGGHSPVELHHYHLVQGRHQ